MTTIEQRAWDALATVNDPEIHRPITDLGMVDGLCIEDGTARLTILLTVAGCPLKNTIQADVTRALTAVDGIDAVEIEMSAMNEEQRAALTQKLRGGAPAPEIPFTKPGNTTRVISIASGKGGVGKSSVTVNLALAFARMGKSVGILDADIYGHSIPDILGLDDEARPTMVDSMIMPVPVEYTAADGVTASLKVISMGMLKESRDQVIAWRGPILDRALTQLLSEVFWGDLDYFLIDLPPGTGDVAMSIGQKLPGTDMLVVTTPQPSVATVAQRAGTMGTMMHQTIMGVVENMSFLETECPHCHETHRVEFFGHGGGQQTADGLTESTNREVPLIAQIPMDASMSGAEHYQTPVVISDPERGVAQALIDLAQRIDATSPSLVGKPLGLNVTR